MYNFKNLHEPDCRGQTKKVDTDINQIRKQIWHPKSDISVHVQYQDS